MDSKHLEFQETALGGSRRQFLVRSRHDKSLLGQIYWHGVWSCYVFEPRRDTVWSDDCLADMSAFLKELKEEKTWVK